MSLDMSALEANIKVMNDQIAALRETYKEKAKVMFADACKSFFEATPEIKSLHWTQYTPYFNDGEECIFGVNDLCYDVDRNFGKTPEEIEEDDYYDIDPYEGDPFFYKPSSKLQQEIADIERALADPTRRWTEADFPLTYSWYLFSSVGGFSVSIAASHLKILKDQLKAAQDEDARYPNRDQAIANFEAFKKFFSKIDEEVMRDAFGDHVQVFVTRNGVAVDDYEHD